MPDAPAPTGPAALRSRRRLVTIALTVIAVVGISVVLYSAFSPSSKQTASPPAADGSAKAGTTAAAGAFTARTLQGVQVAVPGSRPSVLFFFSVGCGGCGPATHTLAQVQQAVGTKANFVAVDIGPGETEQDITDFLTANQATSLAYASDSNATLISAYQVTQLSTAVVLDASGKPVFRAVEPTADQIRAELAKVSA
ncbi:TlpA family protein disulfide reductase [Mycobacterium sp. 4D054]|jgi:thiol-disulfide isomerase/thioredoxin|uniref:Alkyl hydroperoxide reductase n=1 Tax=Mycolicibacterium iranicum TaxID=912594 RepID=A0A178LT61_MYCIR|nr:MULTISPECIES: thioredoxin family protein [Mycobacteriaceae]MBN7324402.1 thioredoxin family protein [Mycobacteroides abscessus subsp. massiliense]OAN37204.1 alkyl hydroperoxide reductase [Mycolicibacterium iranicum]